MTLADRIIPAEALCWGELTDVTMGGRYEPWPYGFGPIGPLLARGDSLTEWFLRFGPAMVAVRDHRTHPPLFSERNGIKRHAVYWHVGPYCLHAKWEHRPTTEPRLSLLPWRKRR